MKVDYNKLDKSGKRHYWDIHNAPKDYKVFGFDTETLDGKVKLIACSNNEYLMNPTIDDILLFLCRPEYHKSLKTFFNLAFDAEAIIKGLKWYNIPDLYFLKETEYEDFIIRYIPKKVFSIKYKNRVYSYYDIFQFYKSSLDKAAKKHLNTPKGDYDVTNLKDEDFTDSNQEIIDYCIKDAILTAKLTELMKNKFHELGINFFRPMSTGNLAEQYVLKNCGMRRFFKSMIQKYAYLNYSGGRFELLKRGHFDKVYHYDINSAYPYTISQLPHPQSCSLLIVKDYLEEALLGYYKVLIPESHFEEASIFTSKVNGVNIYPNIKNKIVYLSQPELTFIDKYTDIEYDVVDGRCLISDNPIYPFEFLIDLYKKRKEIEKDDKMLAHAVKLIMNSIYGKFWQITPKYTLKNQKVYDLGRIGLVKYHPVMFETSYKTGNIFYPIYAAQITAATRVRLLEDVYNKLNRIIAFHTDSITSEVPLHFKSNKLGEWDFKTKGEAVFLLTGVYSIQSDKWLYEKERGGKGDTDKTWFELLKKYKHTTKIPLRMKRRITFGDIIHKSKTFNFSDLNRFVHAERELDLTAENKRKWCSDITCAYDLLTDSYESKPLVIS